MGTLLTYLPFSDLRLTDNPLSISPNQSCHQTDEAGSPQLATKASHWKGPETTAHLLRAVCSAQEASQSSFSFSLAEALEAASSCPAPAAFPLFPFSFPTGTLTVPNWVIHTQCSAQAWMGSEGPKGNRTGRITPLLRECAGTK